MENACKLVLAMLWKVYINIKKIIHLLKMHRKSMYICWKLLKIDENLCTCIENYSKSVKIHENLLRIMGSPWKCIENLLEIHGIFIKTLQTLNPKRGSYMEGIAKIAFWWESFLMQFGIDFCCFAEALGASFIDYWLAISMFEASQTRFLHGRYCKNRLLMGIVLNAFWNWFLLFCGSLGS
jgi:hypothetical protein